MTEMLSNFDDNLNVAIIGAGGGIGRAFIDHLSKNTKVKNLYSFSRTKPDLLRHVIWHEIDVKDEQSIEQASHVIDGKLDIVIIALGMLHDETVKPEKSIRDIKAQNFEQIFAVNTIAPALLIKHFAPLLNRERRSVFTALSARVGSISDNQMGGWYAYRASKAALNMILKNAAIEIGRRNKTACVIGLHPGTVDTGLSEPFQGNVPTGKLFTPAYSTEQMLSVINNVDPVDTGKIYDYAGLEIQP